MAKSANELQQQVNEYLNQQSADLAILRVTLQVLIWNLVRRDPQAATALSGLKDEVLASVYKTLTPPPGAAAPPDAERMRQISLIRTERMFQEIEQALRTAKPDSQPSNAAAN